MKQFTIIGLKGLGFTLANELSKIGHEILVIDKDESAINRIKDKVTHAIISDLKDIDFLRNFINKNMDAVIVNLEESLEETILITMAVKKLGAANIIVKVSNEDHGSIIKLLGVSQIIIPEIDYARQLSKKLSNDNLLDYLPLSPEYGIYEIALPDRFSGKRLNELNLRNKYHVNVIAIKEILKNNIVINPDPDFKFHPDMVLYLLGKSDDIFLLKR